MCRRRWLGAAWLLVAASATAQTPILQNVPPGANPYFGAPLEDNFSPRAIFPETPPAIEAAQKTAPAPAPNPDAGNTPAPISLGTPLKPEDVFFPPKEEPPAPAVVPVPVVTVPASVLAPPALPAPPRKRWGGSGDLGLNGANGNSEILSLRTTLNVQRRTADNLFIGDFLYAFTRQDGKVQQQQALFNARDEILFPGDPWSLFSATQVEYDELRSYRFRVGEYFGAGLAVVDAKPLLFRLRMGAGAQRELGVDGERNRWVPEAVFGYDFRHRIDDRNAVVSVLDYYPRIDDWGQFRVRARFAYELVIDPTVGAVLRLGVQERYDSNPGANAVRNDVNYFTTLGFKF